MLLEPLAATILSVQFIPAADPNVLTAYGADRSRHTSLGLITCDQDDSTYVALDESTKHADVDVVFARSFYAGAGHASGPLSGEILGVIAGADPDEVAAGMKALVSCLEHDACFYSANEAGTVAMFPHIITSLGDYLSAEAGLAPGSAMAYLVAPPMEATVGLDAALKAADVQCVKVFPPPTETNFAAAWLSGEQHQCEAAAEAYAQAVIEVAAFPRQSAP